MKLSKVLPAVGLLKMLTLLAVVALMWRYWHPASANGAVFMMFGAILVFGLADLWRSINLLKLGYSRTLPRQLNLKRPAKVTVHLVNPRHTRMRLTVQERIAAECHAEPAQFTLDIAANSEALVSYELTGIRRGMAEMPGADVRISSLFGFWQLQFFIPQVAQLKVYPDFSLVQQDTLHAVGKLPLQGLKLFQQRGSGTEFLHLREYRSGDALARIDWKASSRRLKLITREYQQEQNQQIIVMLDAGKRMLYEKQQGSHFDMALSAMLLLAQQVLKQGDSFSSLSIGKTHRWLPQVKGIQQLARVMGHFYDLYPDEHQCDYLSAAKELLQQHPKRSLVLFVTSLLDEDFTELIPAIKLLQKQHLVALVNIENDDVLDALNTMPVSNTAIASIVGGAQLQQALQQRWQLLKQEGVLAVSCNARQLLVQSLNIYLRVKQSGML